jgi:hypothetical protein
MRPPFTSYVCSLLLANRPPTYGFTAIQRHWRRLAGSLSDPYQPELHYMRGPGPKWRQKHACEAGSHLPLIPTGPRRRHNHL